MPAVVLGWPSRAAGHAGVAESFPGLASAWSYDPQLLVPLGLALLMYVAGLTRYWHRAGFGRGMPPAAAAAFAAGLLVLSLAFVWPLDVLGQWSLGAHMAQHMLLLAVAAPLLLLGRPGVVWLKAMPALWVRPATWPLRAVKRRIGSGALIGPTTAMLLQAAVMWGWHVPAAMHVALTNDFVHYAMHTSFLGAGLLFWWTLLRSLRDKAAGFGGGAIALVGTMVQMGLLGALLTFSPMPRYPWYFGRSAALGLTPLEDQQLAGLIMWIPGGLPYLIGTLLLMTVWLRRSERYDVRNLRASRRLPGAE